MIGSCFSCLAEAVHNFVEGRLLAVYMNSIYVTGGQSVYLSESRSLGNTYLSKD